MPTMHSNAYAKGKRSIPILGLAIVTLINASNMIFSCIAFFLGSYQLSIVTHDSVFYLGKPSDQCSLGSDKIRDPDVH